MTSEVQWTGLLTDHLHMIALPGMPITHVFPNSSMSMILAESVMLPKPFVQVNTCMLQTELVLLPNKTECDCLQIIWPPLRSRVTDGILAGGCWYHVNIDVEKWHFLLLCLGLIFHLWLCQKNRCYFPPFWSPPTVCCCGQRKWLADRELKSDGK